MTTLSFTVLTETQACWPHTLSPHISRVLISQLGGHCMGWKLPALFYMETLHFALIVIPFLNFILNNHILQALKKFVKR